MHYRLLSRCMHASRLRESTKNSVSVSGSTHIASLPARASLLSGVKKLESINNNAFLLMYIIVLRGIIFYPYFNRRAVITNKIYSLRIRIEI